MLIRLILVCNCIYHVVQASAEKCLMGDMTDVQSWVQQNGALKVTKANTNDYVDLSTRRYPEAKLQQRLGVFRTSSESVKYLSMARCQLYKVPTVFSLADSRGRYLSNTLEYLTFYGNQFVSTSVTGEHYDSNINATGARETNGIRTSTISPNSLWSSTFQTVNFSRLKELDLRACSIQTLNANIFSGMSKLEALYLSENEIQVIQSKAFVGLSNLKHLDLSHNNGYDQKGKPIDFASNPYNTFEGIKRLESLDLTGTKLTAKNLEMITIFGKTLQSLSLCNTNLMSLGNNLLNGTSLKVLDISWNLGIMAHSTLEGLEDTLTVLYAMKTGITTTSIFQNFTNLEILQISYNEIKNFSSSTAATLPNLKYLDLSKNRLTTWFKPTYSLMPSLRYLSLKDNNINVITNELIDDIKHVEYIALSNNFIVCSCMAKDLYKMAYLNENQNGKSVVINKKRNGSKAYCEYESLIKGRNKIEYDCNEQCQGDIEGDTGVFRLVDYVDDSYMCLIVEEGISVEIKYITSCAQQAREIDIHPEILNGHNYLLALIAIPCLLVPLLVLFLFRRYIRYWYITMRNSAMLSLISNDEVIDDGTIFNYDVFVSYCNEDRGWVLDHLLPEIETDCSISVCLHERDFQVGLSILENIVSCMDRSRSIMLIISQRFLLSQWCQFEMHLAQHRLLETRREDLTLVLLEDIPRRLRPNTLHYLMLTKTYIVWPKDQAERTVFWRRLKKSLVLAKNKQESVSIA